MTLSVWQRFEMLAVINNIATRLRRYEAAEISRDIADHDLMFARGVPYALESYLAIGRSAIEMIAYAMILSEKTRIGSVLDLPCGAGRVTRHLPAFLPEAELFARDLDERDEAFVVEHFGVAPVKAAEDFSSTPPRLFDLIYVGSLLTHLDALQLETAVRWLISALAEDGLLVATTSGRRADYCQRNINRYIEPDLWEPVVKAFTSDGFGYIETERKSTGSYGLTLTAPSWLMRMVEHDTSIRIVNFQEAAWSDHQDVLVLQKRSLY